MDAPDQPQPQPVGAAPINWDALAAILSMRSAAVCLEVSLTVDLNQGGGYGASYGWGQSSLKQWSVAPAPPDFVVQMYYDTSASDSQSVVAGLSSLSGTITYHFGGNVAWGSSAIVVTLSGVVNLSFEMNVADIGVKNSSGDIVYSHAVFTYDYSIDGNGNATVTPQDPVLTETGQAIPDNGVAPIGLDADHMVDFQQQIRAALMQVGGGLESQLAGLLEGYGGGPF